jgi:hypothetical protein
MRAMQGVSPNLRAALRREIPGLLALVGVVLVYWCLFHGRLEPADWQGFLEYGDYAGVSPDALYVLGHVQAAVEGDYPFIGRIEVSRLDPARRGGPRCARRRPARRPEPAGALRRAARRGELPSRRTRPRREARVGDGDGPALRLLPLCDRSGLPRGTFR